MLAAFGRALGQEAHVLLSWPALTWQQLHNRLQWVEGVVADQVAGERLRRSEPGAALWAATRTRHRESEARIRTLEGHSGPVSGCAVSPDGTWIVSASNDRTLRVWDATTGRHLHTLEGHTGSVSGCAVSPDGTWIVSASKDRTLRLWDVSRGECLRVLEGHTSWAVQHTSVWGVADCGFSPDERRVVSAGLDRTLRVWEVATGQCLWVLEGHADMVRSCGFSPDGRLIVSASDDKTLRVWEVATGQCLRVLEGHADMVGSCGFSPDGRLIVSTSADKTVRVWDTGSAGAPRVSESHTEPVHSCGFSPDGRLIASASGRAERTMAVDKTLRVWDAASGKCLRVLEGHTEPVYSCEFSPDARAIVSGSGDKTLRVWDAATGKRRRVLKGHVGWVLGCGFSPDGHLIVSASNDRTLRVWDPATGECCCIFAARTDMVHDCEFSPDGRLVLSGSGRGLAVWDVVNLGAPIVGRRPRLTTSNEPARVLEGHTEPVHSCGFSPDGRLIVSASSDETLRVWDVGTGECLRTLEGHSGPVSGCAVSPDGTWIVSASWDRTLRVWEAASGEQILVLPLLEDLRCIAVHPWLPLASCGGGGGGVYILDLVGLEFGPIVVTAARRSDGLTLTCPACQQEHPLTQGQLDTVLSCPAPTCGLSLRPNPFVLNGIAGVASNRPNT